MSPSGGSCKSIEIRVLESSRQEVLQMTVDAVGERFPSIPSRENKNFLSFELSLIRVYDVRWVAPMGAALGRRMSVNQY